MENLLLSFNIVLPLFLCILLGYFLRRIRFFDDAFLKKMNVCVFKVFLPIYLFNNVYTTDLSAAFNAKLMIFSVISVFVLFGLLMLVIPLLEKENPKRGVIIQAVFRSNFALFGLPLALSNRGSILVHGQPCPVVGRICMDFTTVLLDQVPDARPGDEAVCLGRQGGREIGIDEWATLKGTHAYEVLCAIGSRVRRTYSET